MGSSASGADADVEAQAAAFFKAFDSLVATAKAKGFHRGAKFVVFRHGVVKSINNAARKFPRRRETISVYFDHSSWTSGTLPYLRWLSFDEEQEDELLATRTLPKFSSALRSVINEQLEKAHAEGNTSEGEEQIVESEPTLSSSKRCSDDDSLPQQDTKRCKIEVPSPDSNRALTNTRQSTEPHDDALNMETKEANLGSIDTCTDNLQGVNEPVAGCTLLCGALFETEETLCLTTGGGDTMDAQTAAYVTEEQSHAPTKDDAQAMTDENLTIAMAVGGVQETEKHRDSIDAVTRDEGITTSNADQVQVVPGAFAKGPENQTCHSGTEYATETESVVETNSPTQVALRGKVLVKLRRPGVAATPPPDVSPKLSIEFLQRHQVQVRNFGKKLQHVSPGMWNLHKGQLVKEFLALDPNCAISPAPTDTDTAEHMASRLKVALEALTNHTTRIPASKLSIYKEKLRRSCTSGSLLGQNFHQRLNHITDLIYLPEELEVTATLDWERLEQAATMCAFVSEMIGPVEENAQKWIDVWLKGRMRNIAWLRKFFAARGRYLDQGADNTEA